MAILECPYIKNNISLDTLSYCCYNGHIHCVKYLIEKMSDGKNDKNVLGWVGELCDELGVMSLDDYEYPIKTESVTWKDCALQWSAERCQLELVKYLISLGLTLEDVRKWDNYALRMCMHGILHREDANHLEIIKYLTSPNLTPEGGLTLKDVRQTDNYILHWSIEEGYLETTKYLMGLGLNLKDVMSDNGYAISIAINCEHFESVKYLMDLGLTFEDMKDAWDIGSDDIEEFRKWLK
uniref:Ankyrin repeat protein n=1 Tax=Marseillevirus LCMAC102 TaxID=2506603 RepID=A0A481YUP7_9VIRU|nr:MAG: ankyrin repeat protein [Marseillevirus LCMAC102]